MNINGHTYAGKLLGPEEYTQEGDLAIWKSTGEIGQIAKEGGFSTRQVKELNNEYHFFRPHPNEVWFRKHKEEGGKR